MNVKILAIVVAAVMVTAAVGAYLLISNNNSGNKGKGLSSDMFKDYRAELGNSVSLGIVNDTPLNAQPASLGTGGSEFLGSDTLGDEEEKKNRLVGIDDEGNLTEIWFSKIGISDDGRPSVMTQDDFNAQIDKLHVTKDFIYFTVTARDVCPDCHRSYQGTHYCYTYPMDSFYSREYYDQSSYESNKETQSFLIDRQNRNVYSLAEIPIIDYLDEKLVTGRTITGYSGGHPIYSAVSVYLLSVENGNIKFTDLVPNKNINVKRGMMDKNGTVFIVNDTINAVVNGVVMCNLKDIFWKNNDGFVKGSDGNVYMTAGELKIFSTGSMDWTAPDLSKHVSVWIGNERMITKNERLYRIVCSFSDRPSYYVWDDTDAIYYDGPVRLFLLDETVICLNDGSLYAYDTGSAATSLIKEPIAENIKNMTFIGSKVIAYKELIDGTSIYEVYADRAGVLHCDLVSEVVYDPIVIIIKPLFSV